MATLRAGPFATSSDSYVNEPSPASANTLPVNCANAAGSGWNWRYALRTIEGANDIVSYKTDSSPINFSESAILSDASQTFLTIAWYYQAENSFNITLNYSVSPAATSPSATAAVSVGGSIVFSDSDSAPISGTEVIALPSATVPSRVLISLAGSGSGLGSATTTYLATITG